MKRVLITLSIFLFTANAATLNGWDKARFGMNLDVIMKLYSSDKIEKVDSNTLEIPVKRIGDRNYRVVFTFENNKLNEISLILGDATRYNYQDAVTELSKKYGAPANEVKKRKTPITVWSVKDFSVECSLDIIEGKEGTLTISYSSQKSDF